MGRQPHSRPFWYLRRGADAVTSEVDEELDLHLTMRVEELKAAGLSEAAAREQARRQFGDLESTRRYCRQQNHEKEKRMHRRLMFGDLIQDFRISLRGLLRAPLLMTTIVITVGLGIGATTAIFSAVHAILLRQLPYADPARLVRIYTDAPPNKFSFSVADYLALTAQQTQFEQIAGYTRRAMAFSDGAVAERLRGKVVSWTYFNILGITPSLGRGFSEADGKPGNPPTVVVSHAFWQQRLGGRADVIGKPIRLDGSDYTLTGVLPSTVGPFEQDVDFFIAAQWDTPRRKGPFFIAVLGRLRHGTDPAIAASELRAINRRIFPIWKSSYQDEKATWSMMDAKQFVVGDVTTMAGLALGAVVLVWLIACTNASNLLIARVTARRRELAVRTALGASRGRVMRHLLTESVLLAAGAALVGIALAMFGIGLIRDVGADYFPRTHEIALDGPVLAVLAIVTAASALLFGLIPAVHGTGKPVDASLRSMGRSATGSLAVRRLRRILVATQFAVATPLLIVSGLLIVSLSQLGRVDLGFDTRNLLSGSILLPETQYRDPGQVATFWDELQRRAEALPGVTGIAFTDGRPPDDVGNFNNFDLELFPTSAGHSQPVTPWVAVTPEYFRLLGLKLVEGRLFDEHDGLTPNVVVAIVDRAWARRFFPNETAIGKRFHEGGCTTCPWTSVVGVVSDVKYAGLDKPDQGTVYTPLPARGSRPSEEATSRFRYIVLRTASDTGTVLPSVRQIIRDLDPNLPFSQVSTYDALVSQALQLPRSLSLLVGSFAVVALILSIVGIYGVMAYYVQQHAKDIGIRLALGGSPGRVLRLIVGQGMGVVASGVVIGLLSALVMTRLMATLLFGVGAADAFTFAATTIVLLTVALVACVVPATRAISIQPAVVLRNE